MIKKITDNEMGLKKFEKKFNRYSMLEAPPFEVTRMLIRSTTAFFQISFNLVLYADFLYLFFSSCGGKIDSLNN